jgi:DNA polymerase-3 subunit epsilon/oligoribonuclease
MYLIFLDTETTGINPEKHRLLEIAYKVVDSITGKTIIGYESIVAQTEEVWAEADPLSLSYTGLQWEEILKGKTEKVVASEIENDLNQLNLREKSGVFICQNPSFDRSFFLQIINAEMQEHYGWPYHWLDLASMYWAVNLLRNRTSTLLFKEGDLSKDEIAKHLRLGPEQSPHRAMNGVNHLMACYEALLGKFAPIETIRPVA